MQQIPGLYINQVEGKGRSIFTAGDIGKGSTIEVCPLILIPKDEVSIIHDTVLHDFYFTWGLNQDQAAIMLGYGSLYNHSDKPNAKAVLLHEDQEILFEAIRDISAGEEITFNYFDGQNSKEESWFTIK